MMKKLLILMLLLFASFEQSIAQINELSLSSQGLDQEDVFNVTAQILVLIFLIIFILSLIRLFFENKIKNKILDKGISEAQISAILNASSGSGKYVNVKWFSLVFGIGLGLTLVNYTMPLGIHSLAIMAFCVAFSFLGFHFFLQKKAGK